MESAGRNMTMDACKSAAGSAPEQAETLQIGGAAEDQRSGGSVALIAAQRRPRQRHKDQKPKRLAVRQQRRKVIADQGAARNGADRARDKDDDDQFQNAQFGNPVQRRVSPP